MSTRNERGEIIMAPGESMETLTCEPPYWNALVPPDMLGITAPIGKQRIKVYSGCDRQLWTYIAGRGQVTLASTDEAKQVLFNMITDSSDKVEQLRRML